jgi:hypothetical protein
MRYDEYKKDRNVRELFNLIESLAVLALCLLVIFGVFSVGKCSTESHLNQVYSDSISRMINEYNQEVAKQEVLVISSKGEAQRLLSESRYKDELIQRLLKKSDGSNGVIGVNTVTVFDTIVKTLIIRAGKCDTLPVYGTRIENEWIRIYARTDADSSRLDSLIVVNKLDIVRREENKKSILEVTQLNPYSSTSDMQSFEFEKPKKPNRVMKVAALVAAFLFGVIITK